MRLQKGDPAAAFSAECAAMQQLRTAGVCVPDILAEGPGFFAIPDCGDTLTHMLWARSARIWQSADTWCHKMR